MNDSRPEPTPEELAGATHGVRRREPRYGVFLATGAALGLLAAAVVALLADPAGSGRGPLFGYLATALVLVGGLLGGLVAVLLAGTRRR